MPIYVIQLKTLFEKTRGSDPAAVGIRTLGALEKRRSLAEEIYHFVEQENFRTDVDSLEPSPKEQVAFLLNELACFDIEIGENRLAVEHATRALNILQRLSDPDRLLQATCFHSRAISWRELATKEKNPSHLDTAVADFAAMDMILLANPIGTPSQFIPSLFAERTLYIAGYQDYGIVFLRQPAVTALDLQKAIDFFTRASQQPLTVSDSSRRDMILVRVYSYLTLAFSRRIELFGDNSKHTYAKRALQALEAGLEIAKENNQYKPSITGIINQDVATLCFHAAVYFNLVGDHVRAFRFAVEALAIRTKVFFRMQSKVDELYVQLDKAFGEVPDKSQLRDMCPLLTEIHTFQVSPNYDLANPPPQTVLDYHKNQCAPKTEELLNGILVPTPEEKVSARGPS